MGSGVSIVDSSSAISEVHLRKLPETVEEAVYVHERFPLVIDPTEQASRFFKYQTGAFLNFSDPTQSTKTALNRALVHCLLNGRTMTVKLPTLEKLDDSVFDPDWFPREVLDRAKFFDETVWRRLLKASNGDPPADEASISPEFAFIVCTTATFVPDELRNIMYVFTVVDQAASDRKEGGNDGESADPAMDTIAALCGAGEIIRNSLSLVESAFDGDIDAVRDQLAKGYHLESRDGRKHTALSEAASQGHLALVLELLQLGADPNALSDTGRSPLWRAAFNGHVAVCSALLEAGCIHSFD